MRIHFTVATKMKTHKQKSGYSMNMRFHILQQVRMQIYNRMVSHLIKRLLYNTLLPHKEYIIFYMP